MPLFESVWAVALVLLSLGVAVVFGWRQFRFIRNTVDDAAGPEERTVLRRSAKRRLTVSLLIGLCGVLIAGPYLTGLARRVVGIGEGREHVPPADRPGLLASEKQDLREYFYWWAAVMSLLVMALVIVAVDVFEVRRHWARSLRRLNDDRRAMLERQLARLRAERSQNNGRGPDS